jgi:hypothetical protein
LGYICGGFHTPHSHEPETMQAVLTTAYGNVDVLQVKEIERPKVSKPTELVVKVVAAGYPSFND